MSTLKVDTLQTTAGVEVYAAKAWVNFNGTGTVAIRASGNVTSITDNGTGDYRVNLASAQPDANFSAVAQSGCGPGLGASTGLYLIEYLGASNAMTKTTTSFRVATLNVSGNNTDAPSISAAAIR